MDITFAFACTVRSWCAVEVVWIGVTIDIMMRLVEVELHHGFCPGMEVIHKHYCWNTHMASIVTHIWQSPGIKPPKNAIPKIQTRNRYHGKVRLPT